LLGNVQAVDHPVPDLAAARSPHRRAARKVAGAPPSAYFLFSAVFHFLGPSFAVLLFARVQVLGVAWLRIASAGVIFAVWRRPWRAFAATDRDGRRLLLAWGALLAVMNACFYNAISRLALGTVAAIEFLPVIVLAALGARSRRNLGALALAAGGVYLLTDVRLAGAAVGFAFAFADAVLFALYIVVADRAAKLPGLSGIDGLAAAMLIALVVVAPIGGWEAVPALLSPVTLAAGVGVGVCSSVIPYVTDQLAMARMPRATFALMLALLPVSATVVGAIVLRQFPTVQDIAGIALVTIGVAVHREN
jgi:inner membrane transporter RhtA